MAQIPVASAGNTSIAVNQPVLGSAELASANNNRAQSAYEALGALSTSMLEQREKARDDDYLFTNTSEAELGYANGYEAMQKARLNDPFGASEDIQKAMKEDIAKRVGEARTPELGRQLEEKLTSSMIRYGTQASVWENNRSVQIYQGRMNEDMDRYKNLAGRAGEDVDTVGRYVDESTQRIDAAVAAGTLSVEDGQARKAKVAPQLYGAAMNSMIFNTPNKAYQQLDSGAWDDKLEPDQVLAAKNDALRMKKQRESEFESGVAKARQKQANMLALQVYRGEAGQAELEGALKDNQINETQFIALMTKVDKISEKADKDAAMTRRFDLGVSGDMPFDPTSKDDQDSVDLVWNDVLADAKKNNTPSTVTQFQLVEFARDNGMLPTQVKSQFNAGLLNGNPEQQVRTAEMLDQISAANPSVVNDLPASVKAKAEHLVRLKNVGVPNDKAVEMATKAMNPLQEEERKARTAGIGTIDKKYTEIDAGRYVPFFKHDPQIPSEMQADYSRSFNDYYVTYNLDAEQASKMAYRDTESSWGMSDFNGGGLMKYAPEAVYGRINTLRYMNGDATAVPGAGSKTVDLPKDSKWMHEQLLDDVTKSGAMFDQSQGDVESRLHLVVDPDTIRTKSPSYLVFLKNKMGELNVITDQNGKRLSWKPDWQTSAEYKKKATEIVDDTKKTLGNAKSRDKFLLDFNKLRIGAPPADGGSNATNPQQ